MKKFKEIKVLDYSKKELTTGVYQCHILIKETTGLLQENKINGIIKVTIFNSEKKTKKIYGITPNSKTHWGENLFFQKEFKSLSEIQNSFYTIQLINNSLLIRNQLVGQFSESLSKIFFQKNRVIHNKWAILTNPLISITEPIGYIKYSINFIKKGEKKIFLNIKDKNEFKNFDIPSTISFKQKQLVVKIFKGKDFSAMDLNGFSDPYVKVDVGILNIESEKKKKTLNPEFFQVLYLPMVYPFVLDKIKISILDLDFLGKNEYIATNDFFVKDVLKGIYEGVFWCYFYGAREDTVNKKIRDKMNEENGYGSFYKGQLLMSISIIHDYECFYEVQNMDEEIHDKIKDLEKFTYSFQIDIDFIQVFEKGFGKYKLCISWLDESITTDYLKSKNGFIKIFQSFSLTKTFELTTKESLKLLDMVNFIGKEIKDILDIKKKKLIIEIKLEKVPDIIISLVKDNKHISYIRLKPKDFFKKEKKFMQKNLTTDQSVSNLREEFAGSINFNLNISENHPTPIPPRILPITPPLLTPIKLLIYLFQAKSLLPSDEDATADPKIIFQHLGTSTESSTYNNSLNPFWNETLVMNSFMINDKIPNLLINLFDVDKKFFGNDDLEFMGNCDLEMDESFFVKGVDGIPEGKWMDLKFNGVDTGKLLVGVKVFKDEFLKKLDYEALHNKKIVMERKEFFLKIGVIGLRGLEKSGFFKTQNAEIKFLTSSLRKVYSKNRSNSFNEMILSSSQSGPDPNFGSIFLLKPLLPTDLTSMPSLTCKIYDSGFKYLKFYQTIGSCHLNIGFFAYITKKRLYGKLEALRILLQEKHKKGSIIDERFSNVKIEIKEIMEYIQDILKSNENFIKNENIEIWKFGEKQRFFYNFLKPNDKKDDKSYKSKIKFAKEYFKKRKKKDEKYEKYLEFKLSELKNENKIINDENIFETNSHIKEKFDLEKEIIKEIELSNINDTNFAHKLEYFKENPELDNIIKFPIYKKKEDFNNEIKIPDVKEYMRIGFKTKDLDTKHYRKYITCNLEDSEYMGNPIFSKIQIRNGKMNYDRNLNYFQNYNQNNIKDVGILKTKLEVLETEIVQKLIKIDLKKEERKLFEIPSSLEDYQYSNSDEQIMKTEKVKILIYILDCNFYESMDIGSENDAYIQLQLGEKKIKDKKIIKNKKNPFFGKIFELEHELPGISQLKISLFDDDFLNADDLIGETTIDLENRYYDRNFRNLINYPVETRELYNPSLCRITGEARLWVEIINSNFFNLKKKWDITPEPVRELQLRIVVWEVYDLPRLDYNGNDVYVEASIPGFDMNQRTDTHNRAKRGKAHFNWRMLFNLKIDEYSKKEDYRINFKIFDKNIINKDTFAADVTIDLADLVTNVLATEKRIIMKKFNIFQSLKSINLKTLKKPIKGLKKSVKTLKSTFSRSNKIIVEAQARKELDKDGDIDLEKIFANAKIVLTIECLPKEEADKRKVGIGRSNPNHDPYLAVPPRFDFGYNPFDLMREMFGENAIRKMVYYGTIGGILLLIFGFILGFLAVLAGNAINGK